MFRALIRLLKAHLLRREAEMQELLERVRRIERILAELLLQQGSEGLKMLLAGEQSQEERYKVPYQLKRFRKVVGELESELGDGALALDAGCGEGYFCVKMAERTEFVVGLDLSPRLLKRRTGSAHYVLASWDFMPFRRSAFDLCLYTEGLEHSLEPRRTLSQIYEVTNGAALMTFPINEPVGQNPLHFQYFREEDIPKLFGERLLKWFECEGHAYVWVETR